MKYYLILFLLLIPSIFAQTNSDDGEPQTLRSGFPGQLTFICYDENQIPCGPSTYCYTSVFSPTNGSLFISPQTATRTSYYYYLNLTGDQTLIPGTYKAVVSCSDGASYNGQQTFYYKVTPTGSLNTISIAALIFGVATLLFVFAFWKQDVWTASLGSLLYIGLGVYSYLNGIGDYRDWRTELFSIVVIGVGAYIGIKAMLELIEENL